MSRLHKAEIFGYREQWWSSDVLWEGDWLGRWHCSGGPPQLLPIPQQVSTKVPKRGDLDGRQGLDLKGPHMGPEPWVMGSQSLEQEDGLTLCVRAPSLTKRRPQAEGRGCCSTQHHVCASPWGPL